MNVEYTQPSSAPVPKVAAAGIAGTVITVLIGVANLFGIVIPEEVTGAALTVVAGLTTIITFAAAYFKKDKKPVEAVRAIQQETTYTSDL